MNILVTGGAGYIGSHTIISLIENGHTVVSIDNLSKNSGRLTSGVEQITGQPIPFYPIDTRDKDALDTLFQTNDFDAVIHFAAYKAVNESVSQPLDYYENNILSLTSLCRVMKKHDVSKLIFSSSAAVYGDTDEAAAEDMESQNSSSPYGWTKVFCEQILRDLSASDPEFWDITLLRYFNPIGNHESGLIGEDSPDIPSNLLPYVTKVAAGELSSLTVHGDDYDTRDGTALRDYIHVVDLADGHVAALQSDSSADSTSGIEVYNLGSGSGTTVLEFIAAFEAATGVPVPYTRGPRRTGDLQANYANPTKANKQLGWKTKRSLEQAMRDQWRWQQSQDKP